MQEVELSENDGKMLDISWMSIAAQLYEESQLNSRATKRIVPVAVHIVDLNMAG